ncbi:uncharacterized protein PRD47_011327 [Ara ararauna]
MFPAPLGLMQWKFSPCEIPEGSQSWSQVRVPETCRSRSLKVHHKPAWPGEAVAEAKPSCVLMTQPCGLTQQSSPGPAGSGDTSSGPMSCRGCCFPVFHNELLSEQPQWPSSRGSPGMAPAEVGMLVVLTRRKLAPPVISGCRGRKSSREVMPLHRRPAGLALDSRCVIEPARPRAELRGDKEPLELIPQRSRRWEEGGGQKQAPGSQTLRSGGEF